MKIKSVHIDGFGKWVDADFNFTGNPQVIFGNNEAGKTTLVHFITSILFGFANGRGKNKYQQYKPKQGSSYGGSLVLEMDNGDYTISRTAGKGGGKVTVTDPQGHSGGQAKLNQLIRPVNANLYHAIYCFSQQDLASVDELDRTKLGHQLKGIGAAGSGHWTALSDELNRTAATIYRPRGRKWPLNVKLKQLKQLNDQIKAAQSRSGRYQTAVNHRRQQQAEFKRVNAELATAQQQASGLRHDAQLWPVYQSWLSAKKPAAVKRLTDEQIARASQLQATEKTLRGTQQKQATTVEQLKARVDTLEDDDLEFYRQHQPDLKAAREDALQLQADVKNVQTAKKQTDQWRSDLAKINARYHSQHLPLPLSDHDRDDLLNLERQVRHTSQAQPAPVKRPLVVMTVVGIILLLIGLLARMSSLDAIGLIVGLLGIGLIVYQRRQSLIDNQQDNQAAVHELAQFGENHGLSDLPEDSWLLMQDDLRRGVELHQRIIEAQTQETTNAGQVKKTMAAFPRFGSNHLNDWLANLNAFCQRMAQQDVEMTNATQRYEAERSAMDKTTDQLATVTHQKQAIYREVNVKTDDEFAQYLTQQTAAKTNQAAARGYAAQLSKEDRETLSHFKDASELHAKLSAALERVADLQSHQRLLDSQIRQDTVDIQTMVKDGTLSELQQQRANLLTQIYREATNWLAHEMAIRWIDVALSKASAGRLPQIITIATKYFQTLTGDAYQHLAVTNDGISVTNANGTVFEAPELSTGTAEQLYVALRLGFAHVISKTLSLPLIIDDGFVNFDNTRRERVIRLLKEVATGNQVLYLTADSRILESDLTILNLNQVGDAK